MGNGEKQALLPKESGSGSVRFSDHLDTSERDESSFGKISCGQDAVPDSQLSRSESSVAQMFKRLTRSERATALSKEGVGRAAFLIRDAVLGSFDPSAGSYDPYADPTAELRNLIAVICRRVAAYKLVKYFQHTTLWMLVILTFIEPPIWCQTYDPDSEEGCANLLRMQGIPAGGDETSEPVYYYPSSKSMLLTTQQSHIVEWVCLGVIGLFLLTRFGRDGMSFEHHFRKGRIRLLRISQLTVYFLLILGLVLRNRTYQPYLRGLLLVSYQNSVVRDLRVLIQMLPEVFNVLALLFIFITFYAWFGCVMFVDTPQGDEAFPNLIDAWWTLWICITTANYPDVMMASYNLNRWTAIYFISFMILSFFFLLNVILSSIYNEYQEAMETRQKTRVKMARENLIEAYHVLDPKGTGCIDRETVMAIFYILNEDFPEIPRISDEETKLLFAILDKDGSSTISEEEFLEFGNVLLLEFVRTDLYDSFVKVHFPDIYATRWYQSIEKAVKSEEFELVIDFMLVVNAIVVAIQTFPELSNTKVVLDSKYWDGSIDTVWELVETLFTVIYALEVIVKIIVLGWRKYIEATKNVFDFTITILAVVSTVIVYYPNEFSDSRIIRMIVMARVLRLVRLLTAMKRFQLLGRITIEIIPDAVPIVAILSLIMYFFAALGVQLYGGLITRDPSNPISWLLLENGKDFTENEYWANNFNDMISAMNVLFNLLVINNWTECEIGFEATTEAKWCRWFFLCFHVIGVILVNNLVTAFVIDAFMTQLKVMKEQSFEETIGDGEAKIYHSAAEFDGSEVTGTKTSVRGKFIARIRHAPDSEEGRYHERLKHLFSRSSSVGDDNGTK